MCEVCPRGFDKNITLHLDENAWPWSVAYTDHTCVNGTILIKMEGCMALLVAHVWQR